jgi:hypothetical protein
VFRLAKHLPKEVNAKRKQCPLAAYGAHGKAGALHWVEFNTPIASFKIPMLCIEFLGVEIPTSDGEGWLKRADIALMLSHIHSKEKRWG